MKTIQPVSIWFNGQLQTATVLSASVGADNLIDRASFSYQLFNDVDAEKGFTSLASGYLMMDGEAYDNWQTNDYAYDWVAQQLNLTITGEYVPPAPPAPAPEKDYTNEQSQIESNPSSAN